MTLKAPIHSEKERKQLRASLETKLSKDNRCAVVSVHFHCLPEVTSILFVRTYLLWLMSEDAANYDCLTCVLRHFAGPSFVGLGLDLTFKFCSVVGLGPDQTFSYCSLVGLGLDQTFIYCCLVGLGADWTSVGLHLYAL